MEAESRMGVVKAGDLPTWRRIERSAERLIEARHRYRYVPTGELERYAGQEFPGARVELDRRNREGDR